MPGIDPVLLKARLGLLAGRFDVDAVDECDSTSSELSRRADRGAPAGTVIVADRQTAGRGRRGRQWLSAEGQGLTFSLLWRFSGPPARLAGLSLAVGIALVRACESLGASGLRLKWPNDVLLARGAEFAKLAGILIELYPERRGTLAVLGIGLNLRAPEGELAQLAAGLESILPMRPDPHDLLAALLAALAGVLDHFSENGFAAFRDEWMQRHAWQGQTVSVIGEESSALSGVCLGVDEQGVLQLQTAAGLQGIYSGDVSLRRT